MVIIREWNMNNERRLVSFFCLFLFFSFFSFFLFFFLFFFFFFFPLFLIFPFFLFFFLFIQDDAEFDQTPNSIQNQYDDSLSISFHSSNPDMDKIRLSSDLHQK